MVHNVKALTYLIDVGCNWKVILHKKLAILVYSVCIIESNSKCMTMEHKIHVNFGLARIKGK